jgi:hypothetical protein
MSFTDQPVVRIAVSGGFSDASPQGSAVGAIDYWPPVLVGLDDEEGLLPRAISIHGVSLGVGSRALLVVDPGNDSFRGGIYSLQITGAERVPAGQSFVLGDYTVTGLIVGRLYRWQRGSLTWGLNTGVATLTESGLFVATSSVVLSGGDNEDVSDSIREVDWMRASDADADADFRVGRRVVVVAGTNAGTWQVRSLGTPDPLSDESDIVWEQIVSTVPVTVTTPTNQAPASLVVPGTFDDDSPQQAAARVGDSFVRSFPLKSGLAQRRSLTLRGQPLTLRGDTLTILV